MVSGGGCSAAMIHGGTKVLTLNIAFKTLVENALIARHCGVSEAQLRIEFEEWVLRGCLTYAEIDEGRVPRTEDLQECTEAYAVLGAQGVKQENSMDAHNIAATSISGDTDESKTAMQKLIVGSKPSQDLVKVEDMSN